MLLAAAQALGALSPAFKDPTRSLFPHPGKINEIAKAIAYAVALQAQKEGVAEAQSPERLSESIENTYWEPAYAELRSE
jgi:malate dehydrogenase (oxaloacetate-decarboxylating)